MANLNKCDACKTGIAETGAVFSGKFGAYCKACLNSAKRIDSVSKASYERDRDREDHRRDMLQPWLPNGKPNPEFIREYPERNDNFTEEELKEV